MTATGLGNSTPLDNSSTRTHHQSPNRRSWPKTPSPLLGPQRKSATTSVPVPAEHTEPWQVQKAALEKKFPTGWSPRKRLSPDTLDGIRALHAQYPDRYNTAVLAQEFGVSPEAIRRILRSKWRPTVDEEKERLQRWEKRKDRIWDSMAAIGLRPARKGTEISDAVTFSAGFGIRWWGTKC